MPAIWRNVTAIPVVGLSAIVAIGLASPAVADGEPGAPPAFMMTWDASGDTLPALDYDPVDFGTVAWGTWQIGGGANGQGGPLRERTGWRYEGGNTNSMWTLTWDCIVNPDPYVDATINVTNNSPFVQTFWVYMPLPIAPSIPTPTVMGGFVSAVVSDQNFDGAIFSANDTPIYQAYIDGSVVGGATNMWLPGYTLLAPGAGGINNDTDSFNNLVGPPAMNEIAIRLRFDLSPGDTASVTGVFEVVPGPAGLSVFALAGLFGARRRRR